MARIRRGRDIKPRRRERRRAAKRLVMSWLVDLILFVRVYIDRFVDYLFTFYYTTSSQKLPKPHSPLVLESATSLARKIRDGKATSEEVVRAFVERIKQADPFINAVVDSRFDEAIKEAQEVDRDIASGKITHDVFKEKPFLGVPFTTKESTHCKGMKNSYGIMCRKEVIAEDDADVVVLLKKAGGILIGVTNIPQLNMWKETSNPIYGTTSNPYDLNRNAGGSSGGEAATMAACGSPLSISTDIGGSIRIPAFMCGVFGHKPSHDLISTKGLTNRKGDEGPTMVTAGPICKFAEDIVPLLKVFLGSNVDRLKLDQEVHVKDLQVYYLFEFKDPKVSPLRSEMRRIVSKTVDHFSEKCTSRPQKLDLPDVRYGGKLWRYWISQELPNFKRDLMDRKGEVNLWAELAKFMVGRSDFTAAVMLLLINHVLPRENESWARKLTEELRQAITEKLGDNGVILCASAPTSARYHNVPLLHPWDLHYFATWNALKLPVTQVPLGLDCEGLPVGIQVVAAPGQDHLCIEVAKELERAFGGYVPPFVVDEE